MKVPGKKSIIRRKYQYKEAPLKGSTSRRQVPLEGRTSKSRSKNCLSSAKTWPAAVEKLQICGKFGGIAGSWCQVRVLILLLPWLLLTDRPGAAPGAKTPPPPPPPPSLQPLLTEWPCSGRRALHRFSCSSRSSCFYSCFCLC